MIKNLLKKRPLLTLPQIIVLAGVLAALYFALDLNRRAQAGELVGIDAGVLEAEIELETTRRVELEATLVYVQSDDYVADYARNEGGYLQPGEKRVAPIFIEAAPQATAVPASTPDPASQARPWQAWWRLLTDAPYPIGDR